MVKIKNWDKIITVIFLALIFLNPGSATSIQSSNGATKVYAVSSLKSVLVAVFYLVFIYFFQRIDFKVKIINAKPSWIRKSAAFIIDAFFLMIPIGAITSCVTLSVEYLRTGEFKWGFIRGYVVISDLVMAVNLIIAFIMFIAYFALFLYQGKPSIGKNMVGLMTVSDKNKVQKFSFLKACEIYYLRFMGFLTWRTYGKYKTMLKKTPMKTARCITSF